MSIKQELTDKFADVEQVVAVHVNKDAKYHGQDATEVIVEFDDGRVLGGTFTDTSPFYMGGVKVGERQDVVGLMYTKTMQVLEGRAEE